MLLHYYIYLFFAFACCPSFAFNDKWFYANFAQTIKIQLKLNSKHKHILLFGPWKKKFKLNRDKKSNNWNQFRNVIDITTREKKIYKKNRRISTQFWIFRFCFVLGRFILSHCLSFLIRKLLSNDSSIPFITMQSNTHFSRLLFLFWVLFNVR